MIRIQRTPEPKILSENKERWKMEYLEAVTAYSIQKTSKNKRRKEAAENRYNHVEVRKALKQMCFRKCVYCESHVSHVGYVHIEHYKPKSKYRELCFEWDNLLLGCAVCNGKQYKGDKFPLNREGGPFINPCKEDPDDFFEFEFDKNTGTANVIPQNIRGITTEKEIGLNRPDLVRHRSDVVRKIAYVALQAKNGDIEALTELRYCMTDDQEYAAFARAFHRKFNLS